MAVFSLLGGIVIGVVTISKRMIKKGFKIIGLSLLACFILAGIGGALAPESPEQIEKEKIQQVAAAKEKDMKDAEAAKEKAEIEAKNKAENVKLAQEKAHQDKVDAIYKRLRDAGLDKKLAKNDAEYFLDMQNSGEWTADKAEQWLNEQIENQKYVDWRDSHFSLWNGSIRDLVDVVKESMNDPDSFKHVETTYGDLPDHKGFKARMVFRGKNAFGGTVTNSVVATFLYGENTFTYNFEQ